MPENELTLPQAPQLHLMFQDLYPDMQDWILDDVIAWIADLGNRVAMFFADLWDKITQALFDAINWIVQRISPVINTLWNLIKPYVDWIGSQVSQIWYKLWTIGSEIYQQVSQAIQGILYQVTGTISSFFQQLPGQIGNLINQVWTWLSTWAANITNTVSSWIQQLGTNIGTWFSEQWQHTVDFWNGFTATFTQWMGNLRPWFDDLGKQIDGITGSVLNGITDLTKSLLGDAIKWITGDMSTGLAALEKESPWPVKPHSSPFFEDFFRGFGQAFGFGSNNFIDNFKSVTPEAFQHTEEWYQTLWNVVEWGISLPFQGIEALLKMLGTVSPSSGNNILGVINSAATVTIAGLGGMMIAGELVGFFKHMGLGYISAMIYDISNFKELTKTYVTSIASVYIEQPVKYFYNSLGRPYVPGIPQLQRMVQEYVIDKPEFMEIAKYHGYSDDYLNKLYEISSTPARYFALRAIADSGTYDEAYFTSELRHNGYKPETIKIMLDMLRRYADGDIRPVMIGAATKKHRQGFSSDADLKTELKALGVPDSKVGKYLFAANLDFQVDYASDMLAAYRTQFNKDMIDESALRGYLGDLGIQPDRVQAYVLIENAKKFKAPKVVKVPAVVPAYLTDDGKLKANTVIEAFRRDLSTAPELYAELIKLQMDPDLSEAYVEYEIIKKTPKTLEQP